MKITDSGYKGLQTWHHFLQSFTADRKSHRGCIQLYVTKTQPGFLVTNRFQVCWGHSIGMWIVQKSKVKQCEVCVVWTGLGSIPSDVFITSENLNMSVFRDSASFRFHFIEPTGFCFEGRFMSLLLSPVQNPITQCIIYPLTSWASHQANMVIKPLDRDIKTVCAWCEWGIHWVVTSPKSKCHCVIDSLWDLVV